MKYYAIIDTNVLVSSLITPNRESSTVMIIQMMLKKAIVPLFSPYLIDEYRKVLNRTEFGLPKEMVESFIGTIISNGMLIEPTKTNVILPDMNDAPIYEILLDTRDLNSYLITGNIKHFPYKPYVVTPKQMIGIMKQDVDPSEHYLNERFHPALPPKTTSN